MSWDELDNLNCGAMHSEVRLVYGIGFRAEAQEGNAATPSRLRKAASELAKWGTGLWPH